MQDMCHKQASRQRRGSGKCVAETVRSHHSSLIYLAMQYLMDILLVCNLHHVFVTSFVFLH